MTYRWLLNFVEQLPPESRTKTAMRDQADPLAIAAQVETPREGWGPWSHSDHLLAQVGERLDVLHATVVKALGGKPAEPAPWPRPGVLSADMLAELRAEVEAPMRDTLEAERAERARRRAELAAQQQQP